MKNVKSVVAGLALVAVLGVSGMAQTPATGKPAAKPAKTKPAPAAAKSDADIQTDIQQRLAASPKLKSESINVSVSGGVATFTGTVKNAGSKGGVSGLAKAAGAKSVVNNITVEKPAKPAKK